MLQKLHITFLLKYVLHMEECKKKKKNILIRKSTYIQVTEQIGGCQKCISYGISFR